MFDSASKNCNSNIKFVAHLVFDSGRETNKELNFIARSLMASCFFTSKWVYRVLTNFSPNPAKLKFRIHRIKMNQNGSWVKLNESRWIEMDLDESRSIRMDLDESRSIKMDLEVSRWIKMNQDGSRWIKMDQK